MGEARGQMRIYRRALLGWLAVAFLGGGLMPAGAVEFDRGRALYELHCRVCHEDWAHTREGRLVNSLEALRARVASWSVHSGLQWGAEDIAEVTRYLNRRFYQLTP